MGRIRAAAAARCDHETRSCPFRPAEPTSGTGHIPRRSGVSTLGVRPRLLGSTNRAAHDDVTSEAATAGRRQLTSRPGRNSVRLVDVLRVDPPGAPRRLVVILLHGHGDEPGSLADVATVLAERCGVGVLLPKGPLKAAEGGWAWWDPQEHSSLAVTTAVDAFWANLTEHVAAETVILAGFSQGGALAAAAGLCAAGIRPVSGVAVVGGFLPEGQRINGALRPRLLVVHGNQDDVVDPWHAARLVVG